MLGLVAWPLLGWRKAFIPPEWRESAYAFWLAAASAILVIGIAVAVAVIGFMALVAR